MKVLWQQWLRPYGERLDSISKNREQLDFTIKELAPKPDPEFEDEILNYNDTATPAEEPSELEIPDDSDFEHLLKRHTVFLNEDEMGIIWDNLPRNN